MMRSSLTRIGALAATGTLLLGLTRCAHEKHGPPPSASSPTEESAARAALLGTALGHVVSHDARGAARFVRAGAKAERTPLAVSAETAARVHLARHARLLGLREADVRGIPLTATHAVPGGAKVLQFEQRAGGIEVFRSRASVVVDATNNLVSIGSTLRPMAGTASAHAATVKGFPAPAEAAIAKAYIEQFGRALPEGAVRDRGARHNGTSAAAAVSAEGEVRGYSVATSKDAPRVLEATAKRVMYADADGLSPAYYVELLVRAPQSKENRAYAYVVGAGDGRLRYRASLTQNETFQYRVWAEADGNHIPMDGPLVDYTPHPTGVPDKVSPGYRAPNLVSMDGFNKNPQGGADPWLGSADTVTFGNNVRAYSDRNDTHEVDDAGTTVGDGYDEGTDLRADVTAPRTFDRTYDVGQEPNASPEQIKAAVTQMFYVTNWLHDYWYDSGFNEAAGVAQVSNYGRGGVEGDPLRAEAQDGADYGFGNNANMATFAEGTSPRMQMFVWSGVPNRRLETTPSLTFDDGYGAAAYGPQRFDLTGTAVLSDDGSPTPTQACQKPTNVAGQIAVIDRGTCDFVTKAKNAQAGGAAGIILRNDADGHVAPSPGVADPSITIPLIALSKEDGQKLTAPLSRGPLPVRLVRGAEVLHDGTIDNTVVAHEWGHYLHHRLVTCGSLSCGGMSEGWADFNALFMSVREGDSFDGRVFPLAQYAAAGLLPDAAYFGIRRAPYSTDMTKNPFTFTHVRWQSDLPTGAPLAPTSPDMSEVHNVGEIWAQMLFEGYVNLQKAGQTANPPRSFEESKRRMADYLVAGMAATPIEPTFTEQRDAILGVVWAAGQKDDFDALSRGFAKRGLGVGAVSPPTDSNSLDEAVESFSTGGDFAFVDAAIDDSGTSCDHDGVLDSGESGTLVLRVRNSGWAPLAGTKIQVSTTEPSIQFADGAMATIESVDPFDVAKATIGISADRTRLARTEIPIHITVTNDLAASKTGDADARLMYNYDDVPASSVSDNIESTTTAWTFLHGAKPLDGWVREGNASNHVWHGADLGIASDESLVSPDIAVGTGDFTIAFSHRFAFESGAVDPAGPEVFFDGGVLEISDDGGTTWKDVSAFADPGYPQTLYASKENKNVLTGRKAWAGQSAGYPEYAPATLKFGKQLAGKTIKVRFRIGSDESAGAAGWDIDQLTFSGITNLPFSTVVDDRRVCTAAPAPDASTGAPGEGDNPGAGGGNDLGGGSPFDAGVAGSDPKGAPDQGSGSGAGSGSGDGGCAVSAAGGALGRAAPTLVLLAGSMLLRRRRRR